MIKTCDGEEERIRKVQRNHTRSVPLILQKSVSFFFFFCYPQLTHYIRLPFASSVSLGLSRLPPLPKNEDLPPSVLSPTEKDPCFSPLKLLFSFFLFSLIPCSYLPWQATPSFPVPHISSMASSHPMAAQSSSFPGWSEK